MNALDKLIELEGNLPEAVTVTTATTVKIRLDRSPVHNYIEAEVGTLSGLPIMARLYTGDDSILIPYGGALWEWVSRVIDEEA